MGKSKYTIAQRKQAKKRFNKIFEEQGFTKSRLAARKAGQETGMNENTVHRYYKPKAKLEDLGVLLGEEKTYSAGEMSRLRHEKETSLRRAAKKHTKNNQ